MKLRDLFLLLLLGGNCFTLRGMDNNLAGGVTFACDWCQKQKEVLNQYGPEKACKGIDCTHILCDPCDAALSKKYSALPEDQHFFYCHRCRAFYAEKNQVCWFNDTSGWSGVSSFTCVTPQYFKEKYGQGVSARQLPLATTDTVLPNSAHGNPSGNQKHSISKAYPLVLIGLIAAGMIYYWWSAKEEKNEDNEDEGISV